MNEPLKDKIKDAVDHAAGAGTSDKIEGKATELAGKAQQKLGASLDNPELEARGIVKQADGKLQQAVSDTKEEAETLTERTKELLHDVAEAVREKAHYAVDAIRGKAHEAAEDASEVITP